MSGRIYRFRNFALIPDNEPDAEPAEFAFQCAVCNEVGPTEEDREEVSRWTFQHLASNPEHYTYREILILPYRMQPGAVL